MKRCLLSLPVLFSITSAAAQSAADKQPFSSAAKEHLAKMAPIFDGKSLDGWAQAPPYPIKFSGDDIADPPALAKKLSEPADAAAIFLSTSLDDAAKAALKESGETKKLKSALAKALNAIVSGPPLNGEPFKEITQRPETKTLGDSNPKGEALARYHRLLLEDALPKELSRSPSTSWIVKDGAMASTGAGRGVIHTVKEYEKFRLVFTMRHLGGPPGDHAPCVLIFGTMPPLGEPGLDALGAIQFQPPNGSSWDYRPGKNNSGKELFTRLVNPKFDSKEWFQVELLADSRTGTATMAVAQPPGTKAVEVLRFNDPSAGKKGPIAWQMHNKGLFDEFKDVRIEENPADEKLITVE